MHVNALCKLIALQELYAAFEVPPGHGLLYYELQRLWERTGLRQRDLDDALSTALLRGELAELFTDEGRMAVLTELGQRHALAAPVTVHEREALAEALTALDWTRQRLRRGRREGRRRTDPRLTH
jgi:hypothetical protein